MLAQIVFGLVLVGAISLFVYHVRLLRRTLRVGHPYEMRGPRKAHFLQMLKVAVLQSRMLDKPVASLAHWVIYVGFLVINVEVLEIIMDGLAGTHRALAPYLGPFYNAMTISAEIFLGLVFIAAVVFLIRRNVLKIPRFRTAEMRGWPPLDANIILWTEIGLVLALLCMNATDQLLQSRGVAPYMQVGTFPVSQWLTPLLSSLSTEALVVVERISWWVHILGILAFLNYIPFSKHLHIFLAFPNTYYAPLEPPAKIPANSALTPTIKEALGLPVEAPGSQEVIPLGAKDVTDLSWKNLLDAYTCTECGRCTAACPANQTGKKLSPRKIMMDTRDRLEEIKRAFSKQGQWAPDGRSLLGDYIQPEEIWACTTCQACVRACPVLINPMSIIVQLRQNLVMEASQAPETLNVTFVNLENNGSPWAFPAADRAKWIEA